LFGLLAERAALLPRRQAIVTNSGSRTFGDWLGGAERVAAALARAGVGVGDTVALLAPNSIEWLEVAFGCAAVGARLAPVNTWVRVAELDYLLGLARPAVLVAIDRAGRHDFLADLHELVPELWRAAPGGWSAARWPSLRSVVLIGQEIPRGAIGYADWTAVTPPADRPPVAPADDVAMVLFTSGSTARPKGVALTHGHLIENGFEIGERQGLGPDDRLFLASPLFWSLGSANALMATLTHATTLVLQSQFDAAGALDLIEQNGCTAIYTLPLMTHALLADKAFRPERVASLRRGLTFGPPAEVRRAVQDLGVDLICNLYGGTEVYGNCCVSPHDAPVERRVVASGPPLPGVEVQVVDPRTGTPVSPGELGEIRVRGRVSPGYLTESGDLAPVTDDQGWFATEDLGTIGPDGWLEFAGRSSEMIKTAGINVSPAEVEDFLLGHDDVVEAAVTGVPHPLRGEEVVAFVRLRPSSSTGPEELREWARARIAAYKVPARILVVADFPRTSTGKLARRKLRAEAAARGQ
jgi:fatty-acyl-CoA synthase